MENTKIIRRCVPSKKEALGDGTVDIQEGCNLLWVEISQKHGIANDMPYGMYKTLARRWGREQQRERLRHQGDKFADLVTHTHAARHPRS